jgi:polysaccharide export outer membrane protein
VLLAFLVLAVGGVAHAQNEARPASAPAGSVPPAPAGADTGVPLPVDYVIGPEDLLTVVFWREKEMSADVAVRPDGKISLPLINDVQAAGLTPEVLRQRIAEAAARYIEGPVVSVSVREIRSRKVYITGNVTKPGEYPLLGPTSVVQLIAKAGGLLEYADRERILVVRPSELRAHGEPMSYRVNYDDIVRRQNLRQDIVLKPGDTVMVP